MNKNTDSIEHLTWDSNFFNIKVGKVLQSTIEALDFDEILLSAKVHRYDLIYFFVDKNEFITDKHLLQYNGRLVDTKLTFSKSPSTIKSLSISNIVDIKNKVIDKHILNQLYKLAYQSGEYSRFKLDENIGFDKFLLLYQTWVDNSLNTDLTNNFFISKIDDRVLGMLTLKLNTNSNIAKIGLLAVDAMYRGDGFGTRLLNAAESFLYNERVNELIVETQLSNSLACQFYLKNKFKLIKTEFVYHFWIK